MAFKSPADNVACVMKWQRKQVAAGNCMVCGKPRGASKNKRLCEEHRLYTNKLKQTIATKKIAAGNCAACNKPRQSGIRLCDDCGKKKRNQERKRKQMWRLYLDDQSFDEATPNRHPPNDGKEWMVATNSHRAIELIDQFGPPMFIDFDHDLGLNENDGCDTAKNVCKYLALNYPDIIYNANIECSEATPSLRGYRIHSANPEGAKWIESFMESWKKSKEIV